MQENINQKEDLNLYRLERRLTILAYKRHWMYGNKKIADTLGISEETLYRIKKRHNLKFVQGILKLEENETTGA